MHAQPSPAQDRAIGLNPPISARAPWRVAQVRSLPGYQLEVRFVDGTQGSVDMSALVRAKDAGVFASLADPTVFEQVSVQYGAVTWPGEIDLAPDAMYAAIKSEGRWVLR
jgi:hypothetical protein